jgi:hypothetical protein
VSYGPQDFREDRSRPCDDGGRFLGFRRGLREKASKPGRRSAAVAKAPVSVVFVADLAKYARARFQEPGLAAVLKLRPEQRVLFAQTVGYPAKG